MTAREKAIELVEKYSPFVNSWDCRNDEPLNWEDVLEDVKKCALIAASEVLSYMGVDRGTEFWEEVKIEIENL
jgi:hypothetical protein